MVNMNIEHHILGTKRKQYILVCVYVIKMQIKIKYNHFMRTYKGTIP